jgi:predicted transposase YdaD
MAKPFDAALRHLLRAYPADWPALLGLPHTGRVEVLDTDLSTVTAAADTVFRIHDPDPWLLDLELQAGHDRHLDRRVLKHNALLDDQYEVPVQSVIVLLRPAADGPQLTGLLERRRPDGDPYLAFRYTAVRVWQLPVQPILAGGLGTLPLAPLSDVSAHTLPRILRRMNQRFCREAVPRQVDRLWTATYVLMGLRYEEETTDLLLRGFYDMKESVTYQAIMAKGIAQGLAEEARRILLVQGEDRFGAPDAATRAALEAITDVAQLEQLARRLLHVSSWPELLPPSRPRRRRRTP